MFQKKYTRKEIEVVITTLKLDQKKELEAIIYQAEPSILELRLPRNHNTLASNYDKIKNPGDTDNLILSSLTVDYCNFAEVVERTNVKIFIYLLNKNTNLLREKEIDEVKIEDYYQIFCNLINKIEEQTIRERRSRI